MVVDLKLDALLIDHPSDVFYLTGQWFSLAKLVLKPNDSTLLVDGRYFDQAKGNVPCNVLLAEKDTLSSVLKGTHSIGFDSSFVTVDRASAMQRSLSGKEWVSLARPLKELRVCKDPEEISALKRAAKMTAEGYRHILKHVKDGVVEQELALEFEVYIRKGGALKTSFDPIVAFGKHSALPHYRAGKETLRKNQIALFDLGAVMDHYRGDMTRVFFFGEPNRDLERFDGLVKKAHDLAANAICPGKRLGDLDGIVRSFFAKEGAEHLFTHSLGHGVGIDVHEYPLLRADGDDRDLILRPGMVFTIEPGLYLPGVGGVRHENTFVVTESGFENFYAEL